MCVCEAGCLCVMCEAGCLCVMCGCTEFHNVYTNHILQHHMSDM